IARHRHDLIAISVDDRRESELPDVGFLRLIDPETGAVREIDTHSRRLRKHFAHQGKERKAALEKTLRRAGVDHLSVRAGESYTESLMRFFRMRERRMR
ncbi:MAG: DUF58 domain-containing protein, partial [Planctomycetota bacterium]